MSTQTLFHDALLDPEKPVPANLVDGKGAAAGKRFSVYRNNVVVGLIDALETAFPATVKSIGPNNFRAIAGVFVRKHPPQSPIMMEYGAEFPAFVAAFPPLQNVKYLADLARVEQAMRESYHAEDALPLDPAVLTKIAPEVLPQTRLEFAPAVRMIRSNWPLYDIWRFNSEAGAPKPRAVAQSVLVTRPDYDPLLTPLPDAEAETITRLMNGATLGELDVDTNITEALRILIETRALTALKPEA